MEDEEDVMTSSEVVQPVQPEKLEEELHECVAVPTVVDSSDKTSPVESTVLVQSELVGERENEVANIEVSNSEKGEELATGEVDEREICDEAVEESKPKSEDETKPEIEEEVAVMEAAEPMLVAEDVDRVNEAKIVEVSRENEGIDAVDTENEAKIVEKLCESEGIEPIGRESEVKIDEESREGEGIEPRGRESEVKLDEESREGEGIEPIGRENEVKIDEESGEGEGIELIDKENKMKVVGEFGETEGIEAVSRENDVNIGEESRESEGIELVGVENEVKIVEKPSEVREEEAEGTVSEVEDKLSGECVSVDEEMQVRNDEGENVGKEVVMEEEHVKLEDKEVEVDKVIITEHVTLVNEGMIKEVEVDGVERADQVTLLNEGMAKEVEVDETTKAEETAGEEQEGLLRVNEVEEVSIPKGDDVEMVDEKVKEVKTDELVEEKVVVNDEERKELESNEEERMDHSPLVTKHDELVVEEGTPVGANEVELVGEKVKEVKTDELVEEKVVVNDEEGKELESKEEERMDHSPMVTKNDELVVEEGTPTGENEVEMEVDTMKSSGSGSGGKGKRGRNAKAGTVVKVPARKVVGEDVCFICLDGGDLVLCDRRGCPKAYHPTCVDHDAEFFQTKGRWNCGWHQCNQCGKNANFMCYTCQFSLCKACSKDAAIFCVRGNKGFCESCMKTIMVIENSEQNETVKDTFTDKSSWEYLFKEYWLEQKENLCITSDELSQAKNPWKDSDKQQPSAAAHEGNDDAGSDSDSSLGNSELGGSERKKAKRNSLSVDNDTSEKIASPGKRKSKRKLKSQAKKIESDSDQSSPDTSSGRGKKARKLAKSRSKGFKYGKANGADGNSEWASKELLELVMHMTNGNKSVLTQFDVQGLLLEYIKRNKLRDPRRQSQIICDSMLQKLFGKPRVGHFEMLKLLESHFFLKDADDNQGSVPDSDMRQLDADDNIDSPIDGGKSRGKKSRKREERGYQSNLDDYAAIDKHNINLIFLRRNLMEALLENPETFHDKAVGAFVRIRISGSRDKQDIYRLVQIIGTSKAAEPYKVGKRTTDIMLEILNLDKKETISIDTMSNQEFSEDECKRLRQSIKCGLINRMTVGDILEKAKELQEVRVVDWLEAEIVRISHLRDRASEKGRKKELRVSVEKLQLLKTPEERQRRLDEIPEVHADPKMDPSYESESEDEMDTRQATDTRPRDTGFSRRGRDSLSSRKGISASSDSWSANARPLNQKWDPNRNASGKSFSGRKEDSLFTSPTRERPWSNEEDKGTPRVNTREKPGLTSELTIRADHSGVRSDMSVAMSESPRISNVAGQADLNFSDTEKMWHYRDPAGKVQGPFSISQLRKWSNTGYFPTDLRVWRISQTDNESVLLTGILTGRLGKEVPSVNVVSSSIDASKLSGIARSSGTGGRYESSNLPSPTPGRSSFQSSNQLRGGIERLPSPTPTSPNPIGRSSFSHQSKQGSSGNSGENLASSLMQQTNGQQIALQSTTPMSMINQSNLAQAISNVIQPLTGQNPSVYTQGWSSSYAARPETANASMTPNNPNAVPAQVAYGQWAATAASNQVPSYGAGYAGAGNIAQNAWRPPTNMPWSGQQQQMVNPNMLWAGQQPVAAPMGQQAVSVPGVNPGWSGGVPNQPVGTANPGWVAAPGNPSGWGGDQNRNSRGAQRNR